jgi:hypothetical protein
MQNDTHASKIDATEAGTHAVMINQHISKTDDMQFRCREKQHSHTRSQPYHYKKMFGDSRNKTALDLLHFDEPIMDRIISKTYTNKMDRKGVSGEERGERNDIGALTTATKSVGGCC